MTATRASAALRERKKVATRQALANAALELADRHGLACLRIEDITDLAGVSLRTFRNYYETKEAAVVGLLTHNYDCVLAELRSRPDREGLWEAIARACASLYPTEPDRAWVRRMRLLRAEPTLAAEKYKSDALALEALAGAIEARMGRDPRSGAYSRLAAEITQAALRAAIDFWLDAHNAPPLREVVFDLISRICIRPD